MKETYKVKRPDRIIWGDPLYMKEYSGERLKSLIVDIQSPNHYDANGACSFSNKNCGLFLFLREEKKDAVL